MVNCDPASVDPRVMLCVLSMFEVSGPKELPKYL